MDCEGGRTENRQKYKVLACHQYSTVKHFLLKILVTFAHFWPVAKTPFLALEFLPNFSENLPKQILVRKVEQILVREVEQILIRKVE